MKTKIEEDWKESMNYMETKNVSNIIQYYNDKVKVKQSVTIGNEK